MIELADMLSAIASMAWDAVSLLFAIVLIAVFGGFLLAICWPVMRSSWCVLKAALRDIARIA